MFGFFKRKKKQEEQQQQAEEARLEESQAPESEAADAEDEAETPVAEVSVGNGSKERSFDIQGPDDAVLRIAETLHAAANRRFNRYMERLPDAGGVELAARIAAAYPRTGVVLVTGHPDSPSLAAALEDRAHVELLERLLLAMEAHGHGGEQLERVRVGGLEPARGLAGVGSRWFELSSTTCISQFPEKLAVMARSTCPNPP